VGKRFWISWAVTIVAVVGFYAIWWTTHPSGPGANAGLQPRRIGFIAVPLAIPIVIAAVQIEKLRDRGRMSFILVPVFIGAAILAAGLFAGFFPDSLGCPGVERFGPLPPDCTTPGKVRRWALTEVVAVWTVFGLIALALELRNRRRAAQGT